MLLESCLLQIKASKLSIVLCMVLSNIANSLVAIVIYSLHMQDWTPCTCMYIYIYIYTYMHIYIYIPISHALYTVCIRIIYGSGY